MLRNRAVMPPVLIPEAKMLFARGGSCSMMSGTTLAPKPKPSEVAKIMEVRLFRTEVAEVDKAHRNGDEVANNECDRHLGIAEQNIKQTSVTGKLGQIGRIWHRMYPWVNVFPNSDNPRRPEIVYTHKYFKLLDLLHHRIHGSLVDLSSLFPSQTDELRSQPSPQR